MSSLFRFYKSNDHGIQALKTPFIYMFSAKKWEDDGEFDFDIDIGADEDYTKVLRKNLDAGFKLHVGEEGYDIFKARRINLLQKYGAPNLFGTSEEYDYILKKLLEEAKSVSGIEDREQSIRNNFFNHTGISCFTTDEKLLEDYLHWDRFSNFGSGFCIEYDKKIIHDYFLDNDIKIAGEFVKYYDTDRPILKPTYQSQAEVEEVYKKIFFSLHQSLKDEKEFRLATLLRENYKIDDERRKQLIPPKAILSVTFGLNMDDAEEKKMILWLRNNLPHVKTFKMREQLGTLFRSSL